jgi:hypothetical protein
MRYYSGGHHPHSFLIQIAFLILGRWCAKEHSTDRFPGWQAASPSGSSYEWVLCAQIK